MNKSQNLILLGSYVEAEKLLKERILDKIVAIEDRSTKIITNILLICLRYLNKDGANPNNETLIKDLLRLFELKDSKLVEWNFQNLLKIIQDHKDMKDEDKIFLKTIVSIPSAKPKNDVEELKKKIQDFVINKKLYSDTAKYIPDNITEKIVKVKVEERFEKSERDENDWYLWNISLELSREFSGDESVEYVV
ncbi:MAG: hypothetical protein WB511_11050 [Nitrososphaeraceae archaeon]